MISCLPTLVLALALAAFPSADAALFPKKSHVKQIDTKQFRDVLKKDVAFVAAFVAPWCGHCQRLVPELSRTAEGLHPLVPVYAVDCDDAANKGLCAEQGIKGFPTIKLWPKGSKAPPIEFDGTRTASSLFYWSSRAIPGRLSRAQNAKDVANIVRKNPGKPKVILVNKTSKTPLLWRILSNKYGDKIVFGNARDRKGKVSEDLGFEAGDKKHKIVVYGENEKDPILYEGPIKFAVLSDYFEDILAGKVDLSRAAHEAQQAVLKVSAPADTATEPESEAEDAEEDEKDEIQIGDGQYGGFNPHEGLDMEELIKLGGGINPHAAMPGHPGADTKKASSKKAGTKKTKEASAPTPSVSKETSASSASEATAASASSVEVKSSPVKAAEPEPEVTPVEAASEHSKDEL